MDKNRTYTRAYTRAYTGRDLVRAINASAFFGWIAVTGALIANILGDPISSLAAAIGLPIASIACWKLASSVLKRVCPTSWAEAARSGFFIFGLIVVAAVIMVGDGLGGVVLLFAAGIGLPIAFIACWMLGAPLLWRAMRRPISWVAAMGWGALISFLMAALGIVFIYTTDDSLTPSKLWDIAQATGTLVLTGIVIALIVRGAIIGAGVSD